MKRALAVLGLSLLFCCDGKVAGGPPWVIAITAEDLSTKVDNEFFNLPVGATWRYETQTDEGLEIIFVEVLNATKDVWGTTATVVRDSVTLDGELAEDTWDWYAQDQEGTVWYLGEETCEYEDEICVNTAGTWQAGVDGALPGIVMQGAPTVGDTYYQEYYEGQAEDEGEVVAVDVSVVVPAGSFRACIKIRDTTRLVPDLIEYKTYCPEIGGVALEEEAGARVELVEYERNRED